LAGQPSAFINYIVNVLLVEMILVMSLRVSKNAMGIILVLISSVCFAFVPNSAKLALDDGASLYFLLISRFILGSAILALYMIITGISFHLPRRRIPLLFLTSIAALFMLAATYHAVEFIDIGLVLLILYTFPFGVAILARIKRGELLSIPRWFCMVAVLSGLGIMIYDGQGDINFYGVLISILGLISFIFFIETSSTLVMKMGGAALNLYISLIGLVFMLIIFPFGFTMSIPISNTGVIAIGANGLFFVLSWVLFFEGSRLIGITRASLLACVEPLFAALLALAFLGQQLSLVEWLGFFVVLISIFAFEKLGLTPNDGNEANQT